MGKMKGIFVYLGVCAKRGSNILLLCRVVSITNWGLGSANIKSSDCLPDINCEDIVTVTISLPLISSIKIYHRR